MHGIRRGPWKTDSLKLKISCPTPVNYATRNCSYTPLAMAKLRYFTIEPFRFLPFVIKKNESSLFFVFLNAKSLSNLIVNF
jgi:hypothetical protein